MEQNSQERQDAIKRHGRPPTGKALTPAERKQRQVDRDWDQSNVHCDVSKLTSAGLMLELSKCMRHGIIFTLDKAVAELYARTKANELLRESKKKTGNDS